jgi:hypothetical protein
MEQTVETNDLSLLLHSVENLIVGYDQADELLQSQIHAVIANDFEKLNDLISRQIDHYEELSGLESSFREQLSSAYQKVNPDNSKPKLAKLLQLYTGSTGRLNALRDDLLRKVNHVRILSLQLLDLLKYAQDLNVNTLRAVMATTEQHGVHYNQSGKTDGRSISNFSIDQKG